MDADTNAAAATATPPRRRRRWRLLFFTAVFVVALPVLAPYAINLSAARQWAAERIASRLRTTCRIDHLSFSWFSGIELGGVEIGNSDGFDASHPFLALDSLRGDISLARLLRGRFDLEGTLAGLRLYIDQDEDGVTNLERLLRVRIDYEPPDGPPYPRGRVELGSDLEHVRLALVLTGAEIQIRRAGELLESLRDLDCRIEKEFGTDVVRCQLDAKLAPTTGEREGLLHARAEIDASSPAADVDVVASGLDLARYQPLAAAFLEPGELTAIAGVVDGNLKLHLAGNESLTMAGSLQVDHPRLQGSLLQGLDLHGERWSLQPNLVIDFAGDGAPRIATEGLDVDLGFLRLRGLDQEKLGAALGGQPGLGCSYTLDLPALARMTGQPVTGGTLEGTLVVPLPGDELPAPADLLRALLADARASGVRASAAGFELADLDGSLQLRDGTFVLSTGSAARLNGGPLRLDLLADLRSDQTPFELRLDWQGGAVTGQAAPLLRHLVPLFAGLGDDAAALTAAIDLGLELRGPLLPAAGETVLQWLDRWSGKGNLELHDGSLLPAPQLRSLLELLGQQQRLRIDQLDGDFELRAGAVTTKLMRWLSKGQTYGLQGTARLDGALDYGLDVTALLQQHRDGKVVAALLGGKPLLAGLQGTLDAPQLAVPDLAALVMEALEKAPAQLLEQQGQELLQKGLERLFGRKKGK